MPEKLINLPKLAEMKREGEKIAALTAYDAGFAHLLEKAGVDIVLVGDSLGMVIQGHATTLPVTLDDILYHCRCVSRGMKRPWLIADLPFMSYPSPEKACENAARLIQEGGAQMVKLEGGRSRAEIVSSLVSQNIPVCGHLGLLPQAIHRLGGYQVQGRDEASASALLEDALILQQAGASLLILECIPALLAKEISCAVQIPVIGIGAGPDCDGQVLVLYDLLGMVDGKRPRFTRDFLKDSKGIEQAIAAYVEAVKTQQFPSVEHTYQ